MRLDSDLDLIGRNGPIEHGVLVAQVAIHRIREVVGALPAIGAGAATIVAGEVEHHQLLRMLHRQAAQHHLIEQTVNRGVGANAKRECQKRRNCECR